MESCNLLEDFGNQYESISERYSQSKQAVIMSFDVERFVTTPTVGELNSLKKNELLQLLQHYKLTADASLSKSQVKEVVLKHLIDEGVIPPVETTEETAQVGGMTGEELPYSGFFTRGL